MFPNPLKAPIQHESHIWKAQLSGSAAFPRPIFQFVLLRRMHTALQSAEQIRVAYKRLCIALLRLSRIPNLLVAPLMHWWPTFGSLRPTRHVLTCSITHTYEHWSSLPSATKRDTRSIYQNLLEPQYMLLKGHMQPVPHHEWIFLLYCLTFARVSCRSAALRTVIRKMHIELMASYRPPSVDANAGTQNTANHRNPRLVT